VERINFASDFLGNTELPGVRDMVRRLAAQSASVSPADFVDGCLDLVGPLLITDDTRKELTAHAEKGGNLTHSNATEQAEFSRRTGEMLQMIAATAEFQFG
jgi:hypothetical protein